MGTRPRAPGPQAREILCSRTLQAPSASELLRVLIFASPSGLTSHGLSRRRPLCLAPSAPSVVRLSAVPPTLSPVPSRTHNLKSSIISILPCSVCPGGAGTLSVSCPVKSPRLEQARSPRKVGIPGRGLGPGFLVLEWTSATRHRENVRASLRCRPSGDSTFSGFGGC